MSAAPTMIPPTETQRAWEGERVGKRVVERVIGQVPRPGDKSRGRPVVQVRCDCGTVDRVKATHLTAIGPQCRRCGQAAKSHSIRNAAQPYRSGARGRMPEFAAGASLTVRSERRDWARQHCAPEFWREDGPEQRCADLAVARELGRLSLEEIGVLLGLSRERVRQIEAGALAKLRREAGGGWRPDR